jgi:CubicO group peptidase (beta-lactamase class C family)
LTTTLAGIAIDHGVNFKLSTPVYTLFPKYSIFANPDPRKTLLTVEHLLTMSSGLDCDDNSDTSPGNEDNMQNQTAQPDWYKYTLDLPMARAPGEKAIYCSGGMNLVGGIVANTTKTWLPDFFYQNFALPLDIHRYHMNLTPTDDAYGAGGVYLRPRDFLKLGQLFLAGGRWNGRQVVSREWVTLATRPHVSINSPNDYGYGWWMKEYKVGDKTFQGFHAAGNGGQFLIVIPELDLVVMFTAGNYSNGQTSNKFRDEMLPQLILPAVKRESPRH